VKPAIAAANKIDVAADSKILRRLGTHLKKRGIPLHKVSAVTGDGVAALVEAMWTGLQPAGTDA
jgi:50S ribosomal subunit-associated GTPase HflX